MVKKHNTKKMVTKGFIAEGTTCESCAKIIKKQAMKVKGVEKVEFDYSTENGSVTFDPKKTDLDTILYAIEKKGYIGYILDETSQDQTQSIIPNVDNKTLGWIFAAIGIVIAGYFLLHFADSFNLPTISANMGYGLLFVVGLLTGFHCVSMCGGFVVSYTAKDAEEGRKSHKSHIQYGLGKIISYTVIGAVFGLLGSIIAFTPMMRGVAGIVAGTFLVLFGLKMLNIFPILRKIQFKTPKFINRFVGEKSSKTSSPLIIGLLNGLMIACGPLQAIYIMAAGTGSMIEGAKLLFVFGAGTLPVMLGFGYLASFLSSKATHKILKASGAIVIILGAVMINRGLALTGTGYDVNSIIVTTQTNNIGASGGGNGELNNNIAVLKDGYQEIRMEVNRYGWKPDKFVLKKGVLVKWIIEGKEINGCNNAIQAPKLGLKFDIKKGEQIIEFTPTEEGLLPWSCWMGMIPGAFMVKDDIDLNDNAAAQQELENIPKQEAGSCGGGSGCGCGGSR